MANVPNQSGQTPSISTVIMNNIQRITVLEQKVGSLDNKIQERIDMDRIIMEKMDQLNDTLSSSIQETTIHRTYQKAIRNAIYTVAMIALFMATMDLKEIAKMINDFLMGAR